ncbi:winged helix domain-containing protein [Tropicimonas sp. S265A]|uniref:winged helix domain-containing protein n=1 Tax=Tropicimonas sp. S265A TaxID=3415134 RepID=UPI003C7A55F3
MAETSNWGTAPYTLYLPNQTQSYIAVSGRDRWALEALIAAGEKGCTPIDTPGPRWSGYVFNLRRLGVAIETVTEAHDGPFAGTHARYVLRSRVTRSQGQAA